MVARRSLTYRRGDEATQQSKHVRVCVVLADIYGTCAQVFSIHPLTTEDIQMEETREKIELFRNYYLVCFRGFDQDPYSPTYLEPLNMYIIVFREGILSVRPAYSLSAAMSFIACIFPYSSIIAQHHIHRTYDDVSSS